MMPDHCKDVSFREVDFPLTKNEILSQFRGKKAYIRTNFMILRNGLDVAVIAVEKDQGKDLFQPITDVKIVSLPDETAFIRDEDIDVLNVSQLAKLSIDNGGKTVVVSGMFNHVSFLRPEGIRRLRVLDVVPPSPSKLSVLVERAMMAGLVDVPIVTEIVDIDLNDKEKLVKTSAVMFPCRASGLESDRRLYYLDETPEIEGDITLIGCDLSRRIFSSIYGTKVMSIDMCPKNLVIDEGMKTIVKCCKVKKGHEIEGNVVSVPWGATTLEVARALNALFSS